VILGEIIADNSIALQYEFDKQNGKGAKKLTSFLD
jgi:hypothetical protein